MRKEDLLKVLEMSNEEKLALIVELSSENNRLKEENRRLKSELTKIKFEDAFLYND